MQAMRRKESEAKWEEERDQLLAALADAANSAHSTRNRAEQAEKSAKEAEERAREAENRAQDAENSAKEAQNRAEEAEASGGVAKRRGEEAERVAREAEGRVQEARETAETSLRRVQAWATIICSLWVRPGHSHCRTAPSMSNDAIYMTMKAFANKTHHDSIPFYTLHPGMFFNVDDVSTNLGSDEEKRDGERKKRKRTRRNDTTRDSRDCD